MLEEREQVWQIVHQDDVIGVRRIQCQQVVEFELRRRALVAIDLDPDARAALAQRELATTM